MYHQAPREHAPHRLLKSSPHCSSSFLPWLWLDSTACLCISRISLSTPCISLSISRISLAIFSAFCSNGSSQSLPNLSSLPHCPPSPLNARVWSLTTAFRNQRAKVGGRRRRGPYLLPFFFFFFFPKKERKKKKKSNLRRSWGRFGYSCRRNRDVLLLLLTARPLKLVSSRSIPLGKTRSWRNQGMGALRTALIGR